MLIKFNISNLYSFNNEVEFNMTAGKTVKHADHVIKQKSRNTPDILKSGIIYGANASGKSNFIKAVNFAKNFILNGSRPDESIPVSYFKLDKKGQANPSKIEFVIKCNKKTYAYGFIFNSKEILEEWLIEITKTTEKKLFYRKDTSIKIESYVTSIFKLTEKEEQFLSFTAQGTRKNQLFLTESVERNVSYFKELYDWFKYNLTIIFPDSKTPLIDYFISNPKDFKKSFSKMLDFFNTGIDEVFLKEINLVKEKTEISKDIISGLKKTITDKKMRLFLSIGNKGQQYLIKKNNENELIAYKFNTMHKIKNSKEKILFELDEESDGTNRLMDFIPALIDMTSQSKVFLIDEIDRSLHAALTYKLLEFFSNNSKDIESQIIATTHDLNLLDLNLLRRDEIWFIEKNKFGESEIYSLEEFKPRYDKDIRRGYLNGRFGAIPIIHKIKGLGWL